VLRAAVLLIAWALLAVPVALVTLPWTLLTRNASLLYRWGVAIGILGLRIAGVKVRAEFREPVPAGTPCLFLVNHASNLDPPLLASVLPGRSAMLIKRELLRIPLLGWGMRLAGFVPVARSGSVEDARKSLDEAAAVLRSGISLAIFVEGTRSPDGRLLPFKKGPFFLAQTCKLPVVPVTICGTSALLPKGSLRLKSGTVSITFHAPLRADAFADRDALRRAVRAAIASALPGESDDSAVKAAAISGG
jgi:1-acyl-sn-glycerol-3-phosphate acyltransferase